MAGKMTENVWIDITRKDGSFYWADGTKLPTKGIHPWLYSQPDNESSGQEVCGRMRQASQYLLTDVLCSRSETILCMKR